MYFILLILLVLSFIIYLYLRRSHDYWKNKNVPFQKPKLIIGNIVSIFLGKYSPANYISKLCAEVEGPYVGFYVFNKPFIAIKDPVVIKNILVKDFQKFSNKTYFNDLGIDPMFSYSLLNIQNILWKKVRPSVSPVFTPARVKTMIGYAGTCGDAVCKYIDCKIHENIDLKELASRLSTEVIASCAFGINSHCLKDKDSQFATHACSLFPKAFSGLLKGFTYIFLPQAVQLFKYTFLDASACSFIRKVITEVIEVREQSNIKRNDVVDILISLRNSTSSEKLEDDILLSQAITFFAVGHETISAVLALTMYELSQNKEVQCRLREEINEVVEQHGEITFDALNDMKYLHKVVCEGLRMYPVISFIHRRCVENYVIPDTDVLLEKGTPVIIPIRWIHYNPNFFDHPEVFDPERYNDNENVFNSDVYLPFGAGPRGCLGKRLALMLVKVSLTYLIKNYEVEKGCVDESKSLFGSCHTLDPHDGLYVKFTRL